MQNRIELNHPHLRSVGALADEAGIDVYVVGGYVRDLLLGRATKDIDISVVGDGVAFARRVREHFGTGALVEFEKFRTARLVLPDVEIEFVGTRSEWYHEESRKPVVEEGTIADDLRRRDFTVNAMAASLAAARWGEILDPFGGLADLERRVLRTPVEPARTFSEDPLRMMRAFRFAAQLGFEIDADAYAAIRSMADRITIVSMERVRDEFMKTLAAPKPSVGFAPLMESGVLAHVFPEFAALAGVDQKSIEYPDGVRNYKHKDVFYHTLQVLDTLCTLTDDVWIRMAAVLHDIAKPRTKSFKEGIGWSFHGHAEIGARMTKRIFRHLRLPMEHQAFVAKLVLLHLRPIALVSEDVTDAAIRRLLFDAGDDIDALLMLCRSDITSKNPALVRKYMRNYDILIAKMAELEERDRLRNWQPPLSGTEIMEICGIPAGIQVGILKARIENAILDGEIPNEHEAARVLLLAIKDDVLADTRQAKPASRKKVLSKLPDTLRE